MDGRLTFHTYSGMSVPVVEGDRDELRAEAAAYLRRARSKGHDVAPIERGNSWEIQTQANREGVYITDEDGVLYLRVPIACSCCGAVEVKEQGETCRACTYDQLPCCTGDNEED